jgi:hypothetical protein
MANAKPNPSRSCSRCGRPKTTSRFSMCASCRAHQRQASELFRQRHRIVRGLGQRRSYEASYPPGTVCALNREWLRP